MLLLASLLLLTSTEARSYSNGLIFYELATHTPYLPPTVSVSRGRNLASVKYSEKGSIWSTFGQPCNCHGAACGCCAGLKVEQYKFDQKGKYSKKSGQEGGRVCGACNMLAACRCTLPIKMPQIATIACNKQQQQQQHPQLSI